MITESPLGPPPPVKTRARPNHKTIAMARADAAAWQRRYDAERSRPLVSIIRERFFRALLRLG